jgi:hypothetical protein
MKFPSPIPLLLFALGTCPLLEAATVTYSNLPYRGRSDSPFYQSIQNGTTYVEDFEDKLFNTPGIASTNARIFDSGDRSVDEDDGRRDNLGPGWCLTADRGRPSEGSPYLLEISFSQDSAGQLPTHVGAAILGYTLLNFEALRYFQAFDSTGAAILDSPLTAPILVLPGSTPYRSTLGDTFFGIEFAGGISRIIAGGSYSFDHIQYGYGSIPEPSSGLLAAGSLVVFFRRSRGPGNSNCLQASSQGSIALRGSR